MVRGTRLYPGTKVPGKNVSGHSHVWAQMYLGTNESRHKRVWAQKCQGTNVSGHKRVWAQACIGTNVPGPKRVWSQTCGHNHVTQHVWAQSCSLSISDLLLQSKASPSN